MTQHDTSVVIELTNDGLGSAELWLLEMLHVVARDQKKQEKEAETSSVHLFSTEVTLYRVCAAAAYPSTLMCSHVNPTQKELGCVEQ